MPGHRPPLPLPYVLVVPEILHTDMVLAARAGGALPWEWRRESEASMLGADRHFHFDWFVRRHSSAVGPQGHTGGSLGVATDLVSASPSIPAKERHRSCRLGVPRSTGERSPGDRRWQEPTTFAERTILLATAGPGKLPSGATDPAIVRRCPRKVRPAERWKDPEMPIETKRFSHVRLTVTDIERSRAILRCHIRPPCSARGPPWRRGRSSGRTRLPVRRSDLSAR